MALSRSSPGHFLGAAMLLILPWIQSLHQTPGDSLLVDQGGIEAFSEDLAYFVRYGVDTTIALNFLTSGIRSRRVAHTIGRRATALELDWSQVRDWLRGLHIAGWRTEFTAAPRETEELVEFCRSPAISPLRQLLEQHTTAVELHAPMVPPPAAGRLPVELRITRSSEPIEVWTSGTTGYRVGIIAAASHADIALLGLSGLEYRAETDGSSVLLYEVR